MLQPELSTRACPLSPAELAAAALAMFFLAVLYEGLKTLREHLVLYDIIQTSKASAGRKEAVEERSEKEGGMESPLLDNKQRKGYELMYGGKVD